MNQDLGPGHQVGAAVDVDRLLVARDGLGVMTELVMDVAEAV